MSIKHLAVSLCVLVLLGCSEQVGSEAPQNGPKSAYRSIAVVVPRHYDAWVDTLIFESRSEDIGWRAPIGIITCCWREPSGKHAEWQAMPELVLLKWFSFAEQQSYEALIHLKNADEIEEKMKEIAPFESFGEIAEYPRDALVFGLAPGGTVVVWIMNRGENAIEVGRYEATEIETHPEHYREITERYNRDSRDYIEKHGIPIDGW
ncbi:MAG: DUF2931 family protein [Marinobacter sp.]|nr:DUF2931 family protein [Marinobacter sp.]